LLQYITYAFVRYKVPSSEAFLRLQTLRNHYRKLLRVKEKKSTERDKGWSYFLDLGRWVWRYRRL